MKLTIGKKMALGFGAVVVFLLAVSTTNYFKINQLTELEEELSQRSHDAVVIQEMAGMGNKAYSVVADAIINRDMKATVAAWRQIKAEMDEDTEALIKVVDTPEELAKAKKVKEIAGQMQGLFKEELLPLLQQPDTAEGVAKIRDLDEAIDGKKEQLSELCGQLAESLNGEMAEAEEAFAATAAQTKTFSIALAIIGVLASVLIAFVITRGITAPLTQIVTVAEELSTGNIDQKIEMDRSDEVGNLATAFKKMIAALKTKSQVAEEIAAGNLSVNIQLASDKDSLGHAMEKMKNNISQLVESMQVMSREHDAGDIDVQIPSDKFDGAFRQMADGVNKMVNGHITVKKKTMACIAEFGQGNFEAQLEQFPGKKAFINDTIEVMRNNIKKFIADMNHMSHEHDAGDIDVQIPANDFSGSFKEMAVGVNGMVNGHIAVKKKAMACIKEFGLGNFDAPLEQFPGKKAFINETIEAVRANLKGIESEVERLIEASRRGDLSERGEYAAFSGGWEELIKGINDLLDTILKPINEASAVLERLANYDLTARVEGEYLGDHAKIKNSLNSTGTVLHDAISQVRIAVDQVSSASQQIASSSQQVAEGASEQASSLEETTSSMEEMSGMTKQNADNTRQAQSISEDTREAANRGSAEMNNMVDAMGKIKAASQRTAEIIKDINEIAFQTNLLALNAAVEAARAGDAGRGFAVVAEEVRNLAGRAKDAAQNTESLIKESVSLAETGEKISGDVNENLQGMVRSVSKVTDIISEITVASAEQSKGIEQVNKAMVEMDKVTQRSAANSEESSSAAEELAGQSQELLAMVARFKIAAASSSVRPPLRPTSPPVNDLQAKPKRKNSEMEFNPVDVIPMDDDPDFKEF